MKTILLCLATAIATLTGCGDNVIATKTYTFFPTNYWRVKSVVDGFVVVEAMGTNLAQGLRVIKATPVGTLTYEQSVRVELTVMRETPYHLRLVSAHAYPSLD